MCVCVCVFASACICLNRKRGFGTCIHRYVNLSNARKRRRVQFACVTSMHGCVCVSVCVCVFVYLRKHLLETKW